VLACTRFQQRDMDVSGLGFAPGVTPYEQIPPVLASASPFIGLPEGSCGSGDSFETGGRQLDCDVVDMEAYALAKVCHVEGARFACAKFVSDGADQSAATDWQANRHLASQRFIELYRQLPRAAG
jgi:adenosylhomocysteine nucleosidase